MNHKVEITLVRERHTSAIKLIHHTNNDLVPLGIKVFLMRNLHGGYFRGIFIIVLIVISTGQACLSHRVGFRLQHFSEALHSNTALIAMLYKVQWWYFLTHNIEPVLSIYTYSKSISFKSSVYANRIRS